jgi:hypothetical protein
MINSVAAERNGPGTKTCQRESGCIVLDRDIMQISAEQIPAIKIEQTWLNGELVYKRMYQ